MMCAPRKIQGCFAAGGKLTGKSTARSTNLGQHFPQHKSSRGNGMRFRQSRDVAGEALDERRAYSFRLQRIQTARNRGLLAWQIPALVLKRRLNHAPPPSGQRGRGLGGAVLLASFSSVLTTYELSARAMFRRVRAWDGDLAFS